MGQSPLANWSNSFCWIRLSSGGTRFNLHGCLLFVSLRPVIKHIFGDDQLKRGIRIKPSYTQ